MRVAALNEALDALEQRFGSWRVTWGDLIRLQRRDESRDEQLLTRVRVFPFRASTVATAP